MIRAIQVLLPLDRAFWRRPNMFQDPGRAIDIDCSLTRTSCHFFVLVRRCKQGMWLRHLASGGLLVHFLLLITWLAKKGAFTRQCHPLASAAVPAPGGAVQAVEGEVGWLTILVIVILVAE